LRNYRLFRIYFVRVPHCRFDACRPSRSVIRIFPVAATGKEGDGLTAIAL
jgi:hypothetical protein